MIIICFIFMGCFLLFIVSLINNAKTHKYKGRAEGIYCFWKRELSAWLYQLLYLQ
jgi:hypothetical protein